MRELEGHELSAIVNLFEDAITEGNFDEATKYLLIIHDNNNEVFEFYRQHGSMTIAIRFLLLWISGEMEMVNRLISIDTGSNRLKTMVNKLENKMNEKESE